MVEPVTTNKSLIVPNTGDLAGAWGTSAVNPNMQVIDGLFGGVTTITLSSATTILLTATSTSGVWGGSLPQQSNALIKFTGTLTGNAVIQFTQPGFYIVDNRCTVGSFYVQLSPTGAGNKIGAPPGQKVQVFFDGTDMDYVNLPPVNTRLDLVGYTAIPNWMSACTVAPYLLRDGSTYSTSTYPQLGAVLGSTFGGNGITTFGVPDSRASIDLPLDTGAATSARITAAVAGFSGATMGARGGTQLFYAHSHGVSDPGHSHVNVFYLWSTVNVSSSATGYTNNSSAASSNVTSNSSVTGISINTAGSGSSQNVQPSVVSVLGLIKT